MTEKEIGDLKKRVEQLERALLAVSLNKPVGCDENGRVIASPHPHDLVQPPIPYYQPPHYIKIK